MIARGHGHLAVISSAAGIIPVPNELPYSVTKCAVTGSYLCHYYYTHSSCLRCEVGI